MKKSLRLGAAVAIAATASLTLASCGFGGGSGSDDASGGATTLDLLVPSYSDDTQGLWEDVIAGLRGGEPRHRRQPRGAVVGQPRERHRHQDPGRRGPRHLQRRPVRRLRGRRAALPGRRGRLARHLQRLPGVLPRQRRGRRHRLRAAAHRVGTCAVRQQRAARAGRRRGTAHHVGRAARRGDEGLRARRRHRRLRHAARLGGGAGRGGRVAVGRRRHLRRRRARSPSTTRRTSRAPSRSRR